MLLPAPLHSIVRLVLFSPCTAYPRMQLCCSRSPCHLLICLSGLSYSVSLNFSSCMERSAPFGSYVPFLLLYLFPLSSWISLTALLTFRLMHAYRTPLWAVHSLSLLNLLCLFRSGTRAYCHPRYRTSRAYISIKCR